MYREESTNEYLNSFVKRLTGTQTVEPETSGEVRAIMGSAITAECTEVDLLEEEDA